MSEHEPALAGVVGVTESAQRPPENAQARLDSSELSSEAVKAGATALYSCGVVVPEGVSYADVVQHVYDEIYRVTPPEVTL